MIQSDAERFSDIDKTKGEQIAKLGAISEALRQENASLKEEMARELASLAELHEQEMKQQEQEAMDSIAIVQKSLAD